MRNAARWKGGVLEWMVFLHLVGAAGCSRSDGVPRLPVYGTVTDSSGERFDGLVSFAPDQGRSGPSASASLVNGEYRFDVSNGPTAGPNRVIVTKSRSKGKPLVQPGLSKTRPAKNKSGPGAPPTAEWKLSADIPAKGPYQFDFQLP